MGNDGCAGCHRSDGLHNEYLAQGAFDGRERGIALRREQQHLAHLSVPERDYVLYEGVGKTEDRGEQIIAQCFHETDAKYIAEAVSFMELAEKLP